MVDELEFVIYGGLAGKWMPSCMKLSADGRGGKFQRTILHIDLPSILPTAIACCILNAGSIME